MTDAIARKVPACYMKMNGRIVWWREGIRIFSCEAAMNVMRRLWGLLIGFSVLAGCSGTAKDAFEKGTACVNKVDWDGAIAEFTEAIRRDPGFAEAYFCRGCAYLRKSNADQALADFTEAIRAKPDLAKAYCKRVLRT